MFSILNGSKSYITGGVTILLGIAVLVTQTSIAGVSPDQGIELIMAGFALISIKSAIAKVEPPS